MIHTKLINILKNIGFSEKEAKIYITLLELNEALPSSISRKSSIKRSTTYQILSQLQKRGIVSSIKKHSSLYFQAVEPKTFLDGKREEYSTLKQSIDDLEHALPELLNLHGKYTATPQMSVFKGPEGLIQIMEDTLTTSTEILCWANITMSVHTILEDYYPAYIKKKIKKGIKLKGIFPYEKASLKFKKLGKKELREVYLIRKEDCPFENEINIYDDKVAIISHKDQVGVIIQNQSIADTQRAIFELGFKAAKLLEKNPNALNKL